MATAIVPCVCNRPRVVWNETMVAGGLRRLWLRCMSCGRGGTPVDGDRFVYDLHVQARAAWMRCLTERA